jgi:L-amino acid N-acyltransferase YncA
MAGMFFFMAWYLLFTQNITQFRKKVTQNTFTNDAPIHQNTTFSIIRVSDKMKVGGCSMEIKIREMKKSDWEAVSRIYQEGIQTKIATFQQDTPDYPSWNRDHLAACRFVAETTDADGKKVGGETDSEGTVVGWAALTPVSTRCVYQGVAEVSVYVSERTKGKGIGKALLMRLIDASEAAGIWTLQSSIIAANQASIRLHEQCGFRLIGYRERIARDMDGKWQDIVMLEKRTE